MRRLWRTLFLLLVVISPCFVGCGGPTSETQEELDQEIQEELEYTESDEEG